MLTCREVTERSNQYIDGELDFWPAMEVRMHLLACRYCRRFMKQMRAVADLIHKTGYTLPEDKVEPKLLEAFRKRRDEAPR